MEAHVRARRQLAGARDHHDLTTARAQTDDQLGEDPLHAADAADVVRDDRHRADRRGPSGFGSGLAVGVR